MPIEKPLPLMVGNKAFYSLTSYDPVEVTVVVPLVTEEDVDLMLDMTVADFGCTRAVLDDPAWLAEHFSGLRSLSQVREGVRQHLQAMNAQSAEEQKAARCVEVLIGRLGQSVPPQHLAQARQAVQESFTQQMQAEGLTPQQFAARAGITSLQLDALFDERARQMVEADAALDAYAREKKLKVTDQEIGPLLGIAPEELASVIEQVRAVGQFDEMRDAAVRAKALRAVVAECACTYEHESPAQARARVAQYRQMQQMYAQHFGDEDRDGQGSSDDGSRGSTGFKLV